MQILFQNSGYAQKRTNQKLMNEHEKLNHGCNNPKEVSKMKLKEVSYIGIKTFSLGSSGISSADEFDEHNLPKKLELLGMSQCLPKNFSKPQEHISLGDAVENAMNKLFECEEEVAVIVEWTVLTLHK